MFHFGSRRLFQHVFDDHEPNTVKTDTNVETNDETTDSDDEFMSCCEFCQDDHGTSGRMDWEYHDGRTGSGQSDRECRCD